MNTIRRFTQDDYQGFAGAEPFEDGSEPMIMDGAMNFIIVASGGGVEICCANEFAMTSYGLGTALTPAMLEIVLPAIAAELEIMAGDDAAQDATARRFGFKPL